jgi:flagellar protein FliS
MTDTNPYKVYADETILNTSPLGLVVALYEGAIDASVTARKCLEMNDIPGRTKAINKIVSILTELLIKLDDEKGGEISQNLRRLYIYIQGRVIEAHLHKAVAPLQEVEKLLLTVLDGWKQANAMQDPHFNAVNTLAPAATAPQPKAEAPCDLPYAGYFPESGDFSVSSAYAF